MSLATLPYNGTAPDGGDIGISKPYLRLICRKVQYQPLVFSRRCCVGFGVDGVGLVDDSGGGIFLFWSCAEKVCIVTHLAVINVNFCRLISGIPLCWNL